MAWAEHLVVVLAGLGVAGSSPHRELLPGDSPCLHAPCQHGVCVTSTESARGYRYSRHSLIQGIQVQQTFSDTGDSGTADFL
jgi:hypothetical protein